MTIEWSYSSHRDLLIWEERSKRAKYHSLVLYMEGWHSDVTDRVARANEWWIADGRKPAVRLICLNWEFA